MLKQLTDISKKQPSSDFRASLNQELSKYMPRAEAIIRTAEQRIRPVLLTTITTMAGLAPMMFGLSLDFIGGGYSIDSPTALWWKQLATAVVFGLVESLKSSVEVELLMILC